VYNGNSTTGVYYCEISELKIDGGNVATVGVQFNYARESWINDCYITNCVKGMTATQAWSNGVRSSEIVHNSDTNVELGTACNDFTFLDVQLDAGGNYGVHITGDAQAVNFTGCVVQACGKDGVLVEAGRAINFVGGYYEQNNTSNTAGCGEIRISGSVQKVQGVTFQGVETWTKNVQASIMLDNVTGVVVIGSPFNIVSGVTTQYSLQTSTNTQNVFTAGNYKDLPFNDVGNVILEMSAPVFRANGGVRNAGAIWYLDTPDATTKPAFQHKQGGVTKAQLLTETNGDLYIQHYNTSTQVIENVARIDSGNWWHFFKPTDFAGQKATNFSLDFATTAGRPASPFANQMIVDTTLGKPIWYINGSWRDATGATV
jgi:hypothetical protein